MGTVASPRPAMPKAALHVVRAEQILALIGRALVAGTVPLNALREPLDRAQVHLQRWAELRGLGALAAPEWFKLALDEDVERPLEAYNSADCVRRLVRAVGLAERR
jgi:hypothetical protein